MNRCLRALACALITVTTACPVNGQQEKKALPDAEIVGLESATKKAFSDLVKESCDGKY